MLQIKYRSLLAVLAIALLWSENSTTFGEIIFQDYFSQGSGNITNSVPFIDVQGNGWQILPIGQKAVALDGNGHCFNAATALGASAISMIPIGPHGSMTLTTTLQLPTTNSQWVGLGFANTLQSLDNPAGQSGPWIRVNNDGSIIFYGGIGVSNPTRISAAWTNNGTPITIALTYDAFRKSATLATINNGTTNYILDSFRVTNSLSAITARYVILQFPATSTVQSNRWVGPLSVNWYPRPAPLLALPVPITTITNVGVSNGTNDIPQIQDALTFIEKHNGAEVQFNAGETYIIDTNTLNSDMPLLLQKATNAIVDGNGCKILVKNPRIGFLRVNACSNVIVKGFTVDYDPLPFTQGIVTSNLLFGPPGEDAIEFRPDTGYPAPTNANYIDASAVANAERWGTIMNTNYPGRGADDRYTIYGYSNVVATEQDGVFKVQMRYGSNVDQTIQPGDFWCMVSRWNGSSVYSIDDSYQVTLLNLTNYAGSAANFQGSNIHMPNEIGCHVEIGPPPAGATTPRIKSSNADGGYFGDTRIGPWVENCVFTGLSDDVANAYTSPFVTTDAVSKATSKFSLWSYNTDTGGGTPSAADSYSLQVGDLLAFFDAKNGVIFDEATITNVNLPFVSVDHPVTGIVKGLYQTNTLILDLSLNTSAVYLNNQFSNSRIHGIYCRADNMLIAHNSVSGMGESAISAFPALDLSSPNSFVPTNVLILGNVMSDCSYTYEAIHNDIPGAEPTFALVELHLTRHNSDFAPDTFGIYGIRILNNVFLNWRRAPLSLHNVGDTRVIGNYFGPPITNDDLVPLGQDVIADLWSCDYSTLIFNKNVNATTIPDDLTIRHDTNIVVVANAFAPLSAPRLNIQVQQTNAAVSWSSVAPAFTLQQSSSLDSGGWVNLTNEPLINASSNTITEPLNSEANQMYYRAIQR
jgi:hypothetical protein